jgi:hypothetical protein
VVKFLHSLAFYFLIVFTFHFNSIKATEILKKVPNLFHNRVFKFHLCFVYNLWYSSWFLSLWDRTQSVLALWTVWWVSCLLTSLQLNPVHSQDGTNYTLMKTKIIFLLNRPLLAFCISTPFWDSLKRVCSLETALLLLGWGDEANHPCVLTRSLASGTYKEWKVVLSLASPGKQEPCDSPTHTCKKPHLKLVGRQPLALL